MVDFQNYEYFTHYLTDAKGNLISLPLRKGLKDGAFIDWVTVTLKKESIELINKEIYVSRDDCVQMYSMALMEIFGFGISKKMLGRGKFFYEEYYLLGDEKAKYGFFHIGGQNETVMFDITGTGCQAALPNWEKRLYDFLKQASRVVIKRMDTSHDFFQGEYSPQRAEQDHNAGKFDVYGKRPKSRCEGTAWRHEDYTGRTFYVGTKNSTKEACIYEKGRQLGDKSSLMVRFEVRHRHTKDNLLPLDMLLYPGEYLSGAYPELSDLFNVPVRKTETVNTKIQTTFKSKCRHGKNQVGRLVRFMHDIGWSAEQIRDELMADEPIYPKGLDPAEYDCRQIDANVYAHNYHDMPFDNADAMAQQVVRIMKSLTDDAPAELHQDLHRWLEIKRAVSQKAFHSAQDEYLEWIYIKYGHLMNFNKP